MIGSGAVAVITGGGSGIGLALAQAIAGRGGSVALIDVRADRLQDAANTIVGGVTTHLADVRDAASIDRVYREVCERHKRVTLLVTCAGVSASDSFLDTRAETFDAVVDVNFGGTVRCCRTFLPALLTTSGFQIVVIASCFGWIGFPGKTAYCSSKFAVRGFGESLRGELRGRGVGVTVVYPGAVRSRLVADGYAVSASAHAREERLLERHGVHARAAAAKILRGIERRSGR